MLDWQEQPIGRHRDRKAFDCGDVALIEYLRRYARQNHESGEAKTFVAASWSEPARVLGYYTIGPGAIEFARVPADPTRRLGRYDVPIFHSGRLAVDRTVQGQGLGGGEVARADPGEALADRPDRGEARGIDPETGERLPGESRERWKLGDVDTPPSEMLHAAGEGAGRTVRSPVAVSRLFTLVSLSRGVGSVDAIAVQGRGECERILASWRGPVT